MKERTEVLDYSNASGVDLSVADLSNVKKIKTPKKRIDLINSKNLPEFLDFRNTDKVSLFDADLSGAKEIIVSKDTKILGISDLDKTKIKEK